MSPKKRKSFNWYLRQLGLDNEPEEQFLGSYPDGEEKEHQKNLALQGDPTDEEIEEFLKNGGNEWGRITMVHLQEYKARKAEREAEQ